MGMGMGNRQGSGHDVEDESGSLDVVPQNAGGQQQQKHNYSFRKTEEVANNQSMD